MNGLDYSPLQRKVALGEYFRAPGALTLKITLTLSLLFIGAGAIGLVVTQDTSNATFLGLFGLITAVIGAIKLSMIHRAILLADFAARNNMAVGINVPYDNRPGIIFEHGDSRVFKELLTATNQPFAEIGNFQYTVGSGRNRSNRMYGFIRIKLPRRLPHMVLDSRRNNIFGNFTNLPTAFSNSQKLELEGDFNKHFTLYAPTEYAHDALYVFTPDVMQALVDSVAGYDCEVIDDSLYIYSSAQLQITNPATLEKLVNLSHVLRREFTDQTDYYADARVADRSLNLVAPSGARLKTTLTAPVIIVCVAVAIYLLLRVLSPLLQR